MAIPPFPCKDLATLVLGYLAEEQLMTTYDEFLHSSPYLDAHKNEYDRLFMTSLRNIVAEYRALKIYVETCKPFVLRKKLYQCSNLLEIFKYLVKNIDIKKLHAQEANNASKQTNAKTNHCDVCNTLSMSICKCRARGGRVSPKINTTPENSIVIEDSVETTSLADLPGNSTTDRKNNIYPEVILSQTSSSECIINTTSKFQGDLSRSGVEPIQTSNISRMQPNITHTLKTQENLLVKSDESKQKIEEFNTILNFMCSSNTDCLSRSSNDTQTSTNKPICNAGTFQDFATGVTGTGCREKLIVPDSSTSENFNAGIVTKENRINKCPITSVKGPTKTQLLLTVGTSTNPYLEMNKNISNASNDGSCKNIKEKPENNRITILSDVKVDKTFQSNKQIKNPATVMPVTSAPVLQMQTIVINGTPAYKHKAQTLNFSYTKDEIMAMPTIILVPTTGTTKNTAVFCSQNNMTQTSTTTKTTNSTHLLGPLVIDVPSNDGVSTSYTQNLPGSISRDSNKNTGDGLIKTVDLTTPGSLPKDASMTVHHKTSTPNAVPPTRKSSSTPRRNSHVRVLDFATPRRLLHETIDEELKDQDIVAPAESTTNDKSDVPVHTNIVTDNNYLSDKVKLSNTTKNVSTDRIKVNQVKKKNWDADLRALALGFKNYEESLPRPKEKKKKAKKKKKSPTIENDLDTQEEENIKNSIPKLKISKKNQKSVAFVDENKKDENKIILCDSGNALSERKEAVSEVQKINKNEIKINAIDEQLGTPETERLSLQNVIDAKLNLSDLLETPYKQALYDIQMETPKFLGPDLPGEPISDIKIMNIPTPLFLNTPKGLQATPSTYSSRPTDYSSGGSYYKPDDQDYTPTSEVLQCDVTVVENKSKSPTEDPAGSKAKEKSEKSKRPQRKCTRNVSYSCCKTTEDEVIESASVSSETSNRSARNKKGNKSTHSKQKLKPNLKCADNKIILHETTKELPKKFMRIKPRRPTPTKDSPQKRRKKTRDLSEFISSKPLSSSKKTISKDKNSVIAHNVAAAPTKSRRKSSTPRKLHCTEISSLDNIDRNSCDSSKRDTSRVKKSNTCCLQDCKTEQLSRLCTADGFQEVKPKEDPPLSSSMPEEEDLIKIKEYIETSVQPIAVSNKNSEGSFQSHLLQRGFDAPTAKSIERVLLDNTPVKDAAIQSTVIEEIYGKKLNPSLSDSDKVQSNYVVNNNLTLVQEGNDIEEVELTVSDCNEESKNFVTYQFDDANFVPNNNISKLKDKFSMELCIEDDISIRLRASMCTCLFELDPEEFDRTETEAAVSSISNIDKLYTPLKDPKMLCYEIFDSTLTSLDTPLKTNNSKDINNETTVTEISLKVESVDVKEKVESKKRKRVQSGNADDSLNKKSKPDAQYLLKSANIQNIDIESVLSKLHGPY